MNASAILPQHLLLVLAAAWLLAVSGDSSAAEPASSGYELISAKKIWDQGPHNAFTDLIRFGDKFYCSFREDAAHVSPTGKLRVLVSDDGQTWKSAALIGEEGYDLRDPKLSLTPQGELMIVGAAAVREGNAGATEHQSFVTFSKDGSHWEPLTRVGEKDFWLWRVTWNAGRAYGVAYPTAASNGKPRWSELWSSPNGREFSPLVKQLVKEIPTTRPTEATLLFSGDMAYCLHRRDGSKNTALVGASKKPYTEWKWHDLGVYFGGPDFIELPGGKFVAVGRLRGPEGSKTVVCDLDVKTGTLTPQLTLPSGGDTSYPGLVWHDDKLWISYYSRHEGKTSIYLAVVKPR